MAKPKNPADVKAKADAALAEAKQETATAAAALTAAQESKDADAIAKATADLTTAQELEKEAQTAADAAAAALAPPPAPAETAAETPQSFIQHLQAEIAAAEQTGKAELHAWLLHLESHLADLRAHLGRVQGEVSPRIQAAVADFKKLF